RVAHLRTSPSDTCSITVGASAVSVAPHPRLYRDSRARRVASGVVPTSFASWSSATTFAPRCDVSATYTALACAETDAVRANSVGMIAKPLRSLTAQPPDSSRRSPGAAPGGWQDAGALSAPRHLRVRRSALQ